VANRIHRKILVMSGKGGVGKSSIAVNLAVWLSGQGRRVGLLDIDIHGPSIPKLLRLEGTRLTAIDEKIEPVLYNDSLKVMSIAFMLSNPNEAVIWRGPMKHNMIQQFCDGVAWGDLDDLVVDCPPGTGDEALSAVQVLGTIHGVVIVTTPQDLAVVDVRKCVTFCKQLSLPVLGIIENMAVHICSNCGHAEHIFGQGGAEKMAAQYEVPVLGSLPLQLAIREQADSGTPTVAADPESDNSKIYREIARKVGAKLALQAKNKSISFPNIVIQNT